LIISDEIFVDEEICPKRVESGYSIDLKKETSSLKLRGKDGNFAEISNFVDLKSLSPVDHSVSFTLPNVVFFPSHSSSSSPTLSLKIDLFIWMCVCVIFFNPYIIQCWTLTLFFTRFE
jgi:hypothetical protein